MRSQFARAGLLTITALVIVSPAHAQWKGVHDKTFPCTADGKPNLTAPPLRKADGRPDLSGIWKPENTRYLNDISADFKPGEFPIQAWAAKLTEERRAGLHVSEEPDANCLPQGVPKIYNTPDPFKIIQVTERMILLPDTDLIEFVCNENEQDVKHYLDRKK